MRAHVVLPNDLLASIDRLVGPRSRSKFLTAAAEKELRRLKLARAAARAGGSLAHVAIPGWESGESAAAWVRASRRADQEHGQRARKNP